MEWLDPEYLKRETWALIEAACILARKAPVDRQEFDSSPVTGGRAAHIYANLKDATDAFIRGDKGDRVLSCENSRTPYVANRRVRPWDAIQWAKARGDEIPEILLTILEPRLDAAALEPAASSALPEEEMVSLFDSVTVPMLEQMFPAKAKWKNWAERAADNGLRSARMARGQYNPYLAGKWFLKQGVPGWDQARLYRVLAKNLPARSTDKRELLILVGED